MTALAYALKGWTDCTLVETEQERPPISESPMETIAPAIAPKPVLHEWLRELFGARVVPVHTQSESTMRRLLDVAEKLDFSFKLEDAVVGTATVADSGRPMIIDTPVLETHEMMWLQEHPEIWTKFAGNWIAVRRGEVVASGAEPREVLAQAKGSGVEKPLLFKVPSVERTHFYAND